MNNLILCRGMPASGKTTFARSWVEEDPSTRVRVNRDDMRMNLFGTYTPNGSLETTTTVAQHAAVYALLTGDKNVIVDDTNLVARHFKGWLKLAKRAGVAVEVIDIDTPLEECLRRNDLREKRVDPDVIRSYSARFMQKGKLPPVPVLEAEAVSGMAPYIPDTSKPSAWIVDLDGTMFNMIPGGRGPFEWHRVGEDSLNEPVAELVRCLGLHHTIILLSGRDEICRPQTEEALARYGVRYDALYMRPSGDFRRDTVIKAELFDKHLRDNYWIRGCIDDRASVVEQYRSAGLLVAQVDYGDF